MSYKYNLICILQNPKIYIEETIESGTFREAVHTLIEKNKISSSVFLIYCRSSISGNLVLMGRYDGQSVMNAYGIQFSHILSTVEDKDYTYRPTGFMRVYLR